MFFALCLLTAACADAEKPPKGAVTLIYIIGDGLGLAQVSMPVIGGGYVPKAFDRAQGAALILYRSPNSGCGFFVYLRDCATFVFATVSRSLCGRRELKGNTVRIGNNSRCCVPGFLD